MSNWDWLVLCGTLFTIISYGTWKSRKNQNIEGYLLGGKSMRWWAIGLSVMATQASAITFLSTPGQAYEEGMGFIQFYFGMPLAMILICMFVIPLYHKLKIFTAYEYLESRFDLKTRWLAALLFLVNRGLSAGITIFAPSIVLSKIMGWNLGLTNVIIGSMVILYTVSGGVKAVSQTHKLQMVVMIGGMITALIVILNYLSPYLDLKEAVIIAGKMQKMEIVDTTFNPESKYNLWSGLLGGFFLAMSYFATDQSQVQRYISGRDIKEMRFGLIFNAIFKIPMQFLILFIGVMTFMFFQFYEPPVFFNKAELDKIENKADLQELEEIKKEHHRLFEQKKLLINEMATASRFDNEAEVDRLAPIALAYEEAMQDQKMAATQLFLKADPDAETKDGDYIFISFITKYLPVGLVGLLLAVIFSGAMSSTSAELSALSSITVVDFYKRKIKPDQSALHYLKKSRFFTLMWGVLAIMFANIASLFDNLIELVNIIGSLFYGTILGIFIVAIAIKFVKGKAIFIAAIISELVILSLYIMGRLEILELGYLWYNLIGPIMVIGLSVILQLIFGKGNNP